MNRRFPPPADLEVHTEPRRPETDPTLGVPVTVADGGRHRHRLVTIGDSITQGFMSGAVFHTDLSWPAIVATELGVRPGAPAAAGPGAVGEFRFPVYENPNGPGGLPLDLERLLRGLEREVGQDLSWWEVGKALLWAQRYMDRVEDYWERGAGSKLPQVKAPYHNLAVYGADLLDVQHLTVQSVSAAIGTSTKDDFVHQVVDRDNERAWQRVLDSCRDEAGNGQTVLQAAQAMGAGDGDSGIETLVVMLGANNALGSVVRLDPRWTQPDYGRLTPAKKMKEKGKYNIWRPADFDAEWQALVGQLAKINARRVVVATVPAVTIAPIARGVGGKIEQGSRYFEYYTRPWIDDGHFDPKHDPHLTGDEAREIDSAIDAYNATIIESVRDARLAGMDWFVFDLGGLLDSLAARRYELDPTARPLWWKPYELPPELLALTPKPDSRFFQSGPTGRSQGGLFSLDGVHPTTISAGVIAHEIIKIMNDAGVEFFTSNGGPWSRTPPAEVGVDFDRVLKSDSLVCRPPTNISSTLHLLGWLDSTLDWVSSLPF